MDVFRYALQAILPLMLEVLLGVFLRKIRLLDQKFFQAVRKLVFYVALPASLFNTIYGTEQIRSEYISLLVYSVIMVMVLFGLGVLVSVLFFPDRRKRGVVIQSTYRSNLVFIAIPLASALSGDEGLRAVALLSAVAILQFNILAAISMNLFVHKEGQKQGIRTVLLDILKNPLVISSLAGLLCVVIRQFIPLAADGQPVFSLANTFPSVYSVIGSVAKMATPLALISLGGLFEFSKMKSAGRDIVIGTGLRLLVAPILGVGGAIALQALGLLSFGQAEFACLVVLFSTPLATVTGVMAAQMGSDDVYADQLVLTTTVASAVTIFIITCVMRWLGYL